jgi:hypothetical protein
MPREEIDAFEQALHQAAKLQGLSLVRTGDTFALVDYKLTGATLDEIAAFLTADRTPDLEDRRANLRAMLKAERALLAELEAERRKAGGRSANEESAEAALLKIRRRILELQDMGQRSGP